MSASPFSFDETQIPVDPVSADQPKKKRKPCRAEEDSAEVQKPGSNRTLFIWLGVGSGAFVLVVMMVVGGWLIFGRGAAVSAGVVAPKPEKEGKDWTSKQLADHIAIKLKDKGYVCQVGGNGHIRIALKSNGVDVWVHKELTPELAAKQANRDTWTSWGHFVIYASTSLSNTKEDDAFHKTVIKDIKAILN